MDKRLELGLWRKVEHHTLTVIFVIIGLGFFVTSIIEFQNPTPATMTLIVLVIAGLVTMTCAIVTYFWLESKLKFSVTKLTLDYLTTVDVIIETAKRNKWILMKDFSPPDNRLEFMTLNYIGTSSEIVIEIEENHILINARGQYPTDKKIIETIKNALRLRGQEIENRNRLV